MPRRPRETGPAACRASGTASRIATGYMRGLVAGQNLPTGRVAPHRILTGALRPAPLVPIGQLGRTPLPWAPGPPPAARPNRENVPIFPCHVCLNTGSSLGISTSFQGQGARNEGRGVPPTPRVNVHTLDEYRRGSKSCQGIRVAEPPRRKRPWNVHAGRRSWPEPESSGDPHGVRVWLISLILRIPFPVY
jgi:hypothetical protein